MKKQNVGPFYWLIDLIKMCDNLLLVFLVSLGYSKAMLRYIFTLLLITQVKSCTFFFSFYCLVCLCTCGLYNLNNWHSSARKTKELRSMSTVPNKFIFPQPNSTKKSKQTATELQDLGNVRYRLHLSFLFARRRKVEKQEAKSKYNDRSVVIMSDTGLVVRESSHRPCT